MRFLNWVKTRLLNRKSGVYYTTAQRKAMLKHDSKNELIRKVIAGELVIAQMMQDAKITSLAKYKKNIK